MKIIKSWNKNIAEFLNVPTAIALVIIAIFFSLLIFIILYQVIYNFFINAVDYHGVLEKIFLIFLYVEIVASIKLYFKNNYHFPLRFFIYIGITDLIRRIILLQVGVEIFWHALALLVVMIVLAILETKNHYLYQRRKQSDDDNKSGTSL